MLSSAITQKPILPPDAPERRGQGGPFINPDPAFVVARLGSEHVLEFSMHCSTPLTSHRALSPSLLIPLPR